MHIIDKNFRKAIPNYVLQSLLAMITLVIILVFLDVLAEAAIVAALGASTFIVFAMPNSVTAHPRNVIGGHIIGLITGSICYYIFISATDLSISEDFLYLLAAALCVGLAIFLMVITDSEHPPAAGTALGIVVYGWTAWTVVFVLIFAAMLCLAKYLLRRWLRDLV